VGFELNALAVLLGHRTSRMAGFGCVIAQTGIFSGKYKFFELLFRDRVRLLQQGGFLPDFSSLLLKIYLLVN